MSYRIQCSLCGKKYKLPEKYAGRKLKCKECGDLLPIPQQQTSDTDAFISALDAAVDEESDYQPMDVRGLPPRAVGSRQKRKQATSERKPRLTAQKVYLVQGLVAGGVLGFAWSLVWSIFHFDQTGWTLLFINTVVGTVCTSFFGGAVMSAAGKFDSIFAGCIAGAIVMVPINGGEAFVNGLLGNEMWPLYIYFILGIPKGVICSFWIFRMAKDVEVEEE
ncbi:MAG: zinc-ribbon domain-containing protein [Fuerstiella sp.]|nr:zinc-ribbon domain-containing protein [Fuerstiella sp.]